MTPLVSMLGIPAEAAIDVLNDDNAESYWERSDRFDMALDLTGGRAGLKALAEAMRRWIAHVLGVEVEIEPLTALRDAPLTWYVGLDAEGTRIGDLLWNEEDIDEAAMSAVVGLFALNVPRSVDCAGQGQRRAGLSDPGHDGRQDHPHEAAEPGHRPADPASGGGRMSVAPPLQTIAVGVVVERTKGVTQWSEFAWRPVSVLAGAPETPPWTKLTDDGERVTFFAGTAEIELYRTETTYYRANLESGAPALWVALRAADSRAAFCCRGGDRRPGGRRKPDRDGDRYGRAGADAGGDPATGRGLRRRAPCRAAVRQTQARPRRSGSARAARCRTRDDEQS